MAWLIIHESTRIVRCVTTNIQSELMPFEGAVVVPDNFSIGGNIFKIGTDNLTKETPTQVEISSAKDDYNPERVKKRRLLFFLNEIKDDATTFPRIRLLASEIKNYLGDDIPE